MASEFIEVLPEQFDLLRKLLETRLPKSGRVYNVINLVSQNGFDTRNMVTKIYAYEGNITNVDTAFIVTLQGLHGFQSGYYGRMSHPKTPSKEMCEAFEKLIDWTHGGGFGDMEGSFVHCFKEIAAKRRLLPGIASVELIVADCSGFQYKIEDALELDVQKECELAGVTLQQIADADIPKVTENWADGDLAFVEYCIKNLPSIGIYVEGELASWAITSPYGGINALHTEKPHRKKGYGLIVMKALARLQATHQIIPNTRVVKENVASLKVMEKANCKYTHDSFWICYKESRVEDELQLMSWAITSAYGGINASYTEKCQPKKDYGTDGSQ